MENKKIMKHLDRAIEEQVPDVWNKISNSLHKNEKFVYLEEVVTAGKAGAKNKKRTLYKRLSIAAAACLISFTTLTFTPALAAIQELYDKIFTSEHIDDIGLKAAIEMDRGQAINHTFYDEKNDITIQFQNVLTDDKETKLLLSFQSESTNLEDFYLDIFEGDSSIRLIEPSGEKQLLSSVGWGSRYYDKEENKVVEALSFDSLKNYEGQDIRLEIENITVYKESGKGSKVGAVWPLEFKLEQSAISDRETIVLNKEFTFENEVYLIKQVEFSELETRVVVTGSDTGPYTDPNGNQYDVMSKLENQLLNARKFVKGYGYIVDEGKPGVFLKSAGKRVDPIFSKNEIPGPLGEYVMVFAPVKDRNGVILEVGEDIKIPLAD